VIPNTTLSSWNHPGRLLLKSAFISANQQRFLLLQYG
jgi:hypothetical protein